ncbi:MAG: hydroxymethylbilane synthase, partial [Eubacteriales bacterium]|nr:hydroxymethylbilane synthase [Eubacteriales bacterium]
MLYKVGTRRSKLAKAQAKLVIDKLKDAYPGDEFEIVEIVTTGDRHAELPVDRIGGKGVFADEIEKALLDGSIQLAVHSMKDMPEEPEEGLVFADAWKREDPRDVLILKDAKSLDELKPGAKIATGSKRRAAQLLELRPDLKIVHIRGNVDTRLRKLYEPAEGEESFDGLVLAAAGLKRIGLEDKITQYLSVDEMVPAPAQGMLAVELLADNSGLIGKLESLSDRESMITLKAEREFLKAAGGDCSLPVGAYAEIKDGQLKLLCVVGNEDGTKLARAFAVRELTGTGKGTADGPVNELTNGSANDEHTNELI